MTISSTSRVFGWAALVLAVGIAAWSVKAFVVEPPQINRLDLVDLGMGVVAAVTVLIAGLRVLAGKSVWQSLLFGCVVLFGLFVLALAIALKDFS